MALFNSSNPTLQEKTFRDTQIEGVSTGDEMSANGTLNKLGILFLLMGASTLFSWNQVYQGSNPVPMMMIGVFGGLGLAIVLMIKKQWAHIIAPAYAVLEGLFVGSISALFNMQLKGLPMQAVALTLLVVLVMFLIYRYKIIKVTGRFRQVITIATVAIAVFYLIQWLTYSFGGSAIGASITNSTTPLSIGFSIVVTALAAFNLLLDFDTVEKGVEMRAPKYMEWYCAFGLLVTIVWLYLEILRLLSKLQRN
ncbi:MAG: Bax inhibitor-1/YccA family protein [Bacteroidetes bacterium]|nr:Bax inhibitor-1/YccA family protein [Bacteroidota bacterium]